MKIVNENAKFEKTLPGEVFKSCNVYCMKTAKPVDIENSPILNYYNAIRLSTGGYIHFEDSQEVSAVKCKLVIEN